MDAIITSAAAYVGDYVFSIAKEEFKTVWYLKNEMDRISGELATINAQGAMEIAEKKLLQDKEVRKWVRDLKNAAYDMEDVVCDYRAVVSSEDGQGVLARFTRLAKFTPLIEIGHRLRSINRNLVEINQRMKNLSLDGGMVGEGNPAGPSLWQYEEWSMIGRTETKIQIKEDLLKYAVASNEGSCSKLFVIGIVGAGGMGKTTLAHSIFIDEDVVAAFSNKKWVYVGVKFDITRVMNEIIGDNSQLVREDDLLSAMREKFRDRSLLIVLDDAWCDESVKWRLLQSSLSKGTKAHALIVTTRNKAVARATRHDSECLEHELLGLPYTECMEIFKRWAFMGEQAERYPDLEGLSKRVVQKLKGNPLAATMMGTFLHEHLGNRTMWINVVNDWPHTNEGNVVDRVVGLSYLHLSPHLKLCFAYCALFGKGFRFEKKTLVQMWIAQGYVQSPPGGLMEHSANFDDLYKRSFFQLGSTVESRYSGGRDYYIMHDLIHDFAQKVFTEGCRMDASDTTEDDGTPYEEIRHLSFHYRNGTDQPLKRLHNFKKLRTLMLESDDTAAPLAPLDVLAKFKYLRLLVLKASQLSEFPDSIRHLRFLRYLDISRTRIRALPELVCDLVELQFLKLSSCCALPEGMNKLTNLRFIDTAYTYEQVPQFKGIGMLTSLQGCGRRLRFRVDNRSGWKISELKGLNHLHGELDVRGLRDVTCREEAEQACLTQKEYLDDLVLDWGLEEEDEEEETVDVVESQQVQQDVRNEDVETQVLEGLFPPPHLKALRIYNNRGARFPSWMEEHDRCPISSSVVTLGLHDCCKWECLPTLGRWPYLKELRISGAHGVKKIGPEFYGGGTVYFPRLEILSLEDMGEWEEWEMPAAGEIPSGGGGLHISDCPKLASLAPILHHSTNLESQEISTCAALASLDGCGSTFPSRLKELIIGGCPKLASLTPILRHSTNLESLEISTCAALASLDGCGSALPSRLKHLMVENCPKLASLVPILHHSTNLERVDIMGCADQLGLSWEEERGWMLPSRLKRLWIQECSWKLLPSLSHLTALQELTIWGFPNLRCIPPCLHSLRSLQRLQIFDCPAIESLPEGGLPPSLRNLYIVRCPLLVGRCREGGPDRPKIPTTTTVFFDRVAVLPLVSGKSGDEPFLKSGDGDGPRFRILDSSDGPWLMYTER